MDFLMNAITFVGGVGAVLIGVVIVGSVIAVGLLPLLFINRPSELKAVISDDQENLERLPRPV